MDVNEELVMQEFDVATMLATNTGKMLVCGLFNGSIQFWDVEKKDMSLEIPSHLAEITSLAISIDQRILVSAGADYLINVWDAEKMCLLFEIRE